VTPAAGGRAAASSEGQEWIHRPVRGQDAQKVYRCPGCDQEIKIGQPHIVAWRDDWSGDASDRRHWHTACWRARHRLPAARRHRSTGRY
jgi:hypothetical protein